MINDAPLPVKIVAYFRDKAVNGQCAIPQAELVASLWRQRVSSDGVLDDSIRNSLYVNICSAKDMLSPWEVLKCRKWYALYLYHQCVPLLYPVETPAETLWACVVTILQSCQETQKIADILAPWKSQINTSVKIADAQGVLSMANIVFAKQDAIAGPGLLLVHHLDRLASWLLVWNGVSIDPLQTYNDIESLDLLSVYQVRSEKPKIKKEQSKPKMIYHGRNVGWLSA